MNWRVNAPWKADPPQLCAKMINKHPDSPEWDGMWANLDCLQNILPVCKQKALTGKLFLYFLKIFKAYSELIYDSCAFLHAQSYNAKKAFLIFFGILIFLRKHQKCLKNAQKECKKVLGV